MMTKASENAVQATNNGERTIRLVVIAFVLAFGLTAWHYTRMGVAASDASQAQSRKAECTALIDEIKLLQSSDESQRLVAPENFLASSYIRTAAKSLDLDDRLNVSVIAKTEVGDSAIVRHEIEIELRESISLLELTTFLASLAAGDIPIICDRIELVRPATRDIASLEESGQLDQWQVNRLVLAYWINEPRRVRSGT